MATASPRGFQNDVLFIDEFSSFLSVSSRPGAGKSTICQEVVGLLTAQGSIHAPTTTAPRYLYLDLDVCVPQWMRVNNTSTAFLVETNNITTHRDLSLDFKQDNFAKGIYPSLKQRFDFVSDACVYVDNQIQSAFTIPNSQVVVIISFSFVNTDMRVAFREKYPCCHWILVDTKQHVADERITTREGHFYKGAQNTMNARLNQHTNPQNNTTSQSEDKADIDSGENSEWEFQPVAFDHTVLDGCDTINYNAIRIVELINLHLTKQHGA